jgi:ketosteroid isomerase-like protein
MIKRGETVAARIAMFLTIKHGKIIREVDYVIPNPGDTDS